MQETRRRRRGFTLIEILVVIAILAVIGSVAAVKYMAYLKDANIKTAGIKIRELEKTIELFYSQHQRYPETGAFSHLLQSVGVGRQLLWCDNIAAAARRKAAVTRTGCGSCR